MEMNGEYFTSPFRDYIAQKMQVPFKFGRKYAKQKVKTFEAPEARYSICKVTCYDLGADGKRTFSSDWYEVYDAAHPDLVDGEEVFSGQEEEIAGFLLELDQQREFFSYKGRDDETEGDDCIFTYEPLDNKEVKSLDNLIKQKLDALYRT